MKLEGITCAEDTKCGDTYEAVIVKESDIGVQCIVCYLGL